MQWIGAANDNAYYTTVLNSIREQVLAGNDDFAYIASLFGNLYDFIDSKGANLLHYSCREGDAYMTQWLINYGFYVDSYNIFGESPLMMTLLKNSEEVAKILLRANATVELANSCGQSILHEVATGLVNIDSIIPGALLLKLLEKCTTVEEAAKKLYQVRCPLNLAMLLKNSEITEWLLKWGVRDVPGHDQPPALHMSVYLHDCKSVDILLKYVNVNSTDYEGGGPLMYIRESEFSNGEQLIILNNLLSRGASFLTVHGTLHFQYMQIYNILRNCSPETIRVLLQKNLDLCTEDGDGNTVLHLLTKNKQPGIDKLLQPLNLKVESRNYFNISVLESAASVNNTKMVQLLLEKNANINSQNGYGYTPLFFAMMCETKLQDVTCVEVLIENQAEIQIVTHLGMTLFDVVLEYETINLVQPVLAHLARLEATGTTIKNKIRMKIKSDNRLERPYNLYKNQIEKLKNTVVFNEITMFKLLTESKKKVLIYLRNSQLVSNFQNIAYKKEEETFYHKEIQNRVEDSLRKINLQQCAAGVLGDIVKCSYDSHPTVMDQMLSYLAEKDLRHITGMQNLQINA